MKQEVFPTRVEWWKEENQVWNLVPEKEVGWVMQRPPGKVQGLVWEHSLWDVKQPCVDVEMLRGTWLYSFGVQERALNLRFTCGSHWQWYFKPTRIGWDHQRNQSFKDYIPGSQTARCHENEDELEMRSIWTLMRRGDSKGGYLKATRRQEFPEGGHGQEGQLLYAGPGRWAQSWPLVQTPKPHFKQTTHSQDQLKISSP